MCAARHADPDGATIPCTLAQLAVGRPATVTAVSPEHAGDLLREGILPEARVSVVTRAPLGGPLIVRVGRRARVAISRGLATEVRVATGDLERSG
jgi:Fe2+ transport system protein FeoA